MKKLIFIFFLLLLGAGAVAGYVFLVDRVNPEVGLFPLSDLASPKRTFTVQLRDVGSGLKNAKVVVSQGNKEITLLDQTYASPQKDATEHFTLEPAGLHDGPFSLTITTTDRSIANFGRGNTTVLTKNLNLDTTPPRIDVSSEIHNIRQGGAGVVSFTLSEEPESVGVTVGKLFFPAYKQENGRYAAFYVFPYNVSVQDFAPRIKAVDKAGNETLSGFRFRAFPKVFRQDKIMISDSFLNAKMPQYYNIVTDTRDNLQIYLRVNNELRRENSVFLHKLGQQSAPKMLWDKKAFMRLPNAAPRAGFGDQRTYYYQGQEIDHQTHMGVDLASLAGATVPAANSGVVVFADFFGIYGQTVIIDHGLGLQTLYAHLSQIDVKKGQAVKKGEPIGKTGTTGLAGGDHLHFAVLVDGTETSPIEWWDQHWINDNILSKF